MRLTVGTVFLNALSEASMDVIYACGLRLSFVASSLGFTALSLAPGCCSCRAAASRRGMGHVPVDRLRLDDPP